MGRLLVWSDPEDFQCSCETHSEGIGDYYNAMICPECHVGTLRTHPELPRWLKCGLCGFSTVETVKRATLEELMLDQMEDLRLDMENELMRLTESIDFENEDEFDAES